MPKLRHWSGKYITRAEGQSLWVRADYVDSMRPRLNAAGKYETGQTLMTAGRQYIEFVAA